MTGSLQFYKWIRVILQSPRYTVLVNNFVWLTKKKKKRERVGVGLIHLSRFVLQSKCFLPLFHLMIFSLWDVPVYVTFHCFMNMIDGNPMKLTTSSSLKKT